MSAITTPPVTWQWPGDVVDYARECKAEVCLDPLLVAIRELFPTVRNLKVFLRPDQEIADIYYIVFEVRTAPMSQDEYLGAMQRWREARKRICSFPATHPFCLSLLPDAA